MSEGPFALTADASSYINGKKYNKILVQYYIYEKLYVVFYFLVKILKVCIGRR